MIDFEQAQALWDAPNRLEIPATMEDEPQWVIIGKIGNKHWSAIITIRTGRIRLISVRRARLEEVEWYESEKFR
ncbi:MAG: BrnT family toxin [Nitrospirales bacterium]|nr:BrnT family toxin [Nitrospirales bacterium]